MKIFYSENLQDLDLDIIESTEGLVKVGHFGDKELYIAAEAKFLSISEEALVPVLGVPSIGNFYVEDGKYYSVYEEDFFTEANIEAEVIKSSDYIYDITAGEFHKKPYTVPENYILATKSITPIKNMDCYYDPSQSKSCDICDSVIPAHATTCSCSSTAKKLWSSSNHGLNNYNYAPAFVNRGSVGATFGIELEMVGKEHAHPNMASRFANNDFLYLMSDGSLPSYGAEMACHPFTYEWYTKHKHTDPFMLDYLRKIGMESKEHHQCGLHVHIDKSAFRSETHFNLWAKLITLNPKFLEKICGRQTNSYTQKMFFSSDVNEYNLNNSGSDSSKHYVFAIRPKTVEFRLFKGDFDNVPVAIEFLAATIEYSKKIRTVIGWTKFKAWLADNIESYPALEEMFIKRKVPKGTIRVDSTSDWADDWK